MLFPYLTQSLSISVCSVSKLCPTLWHTMNRIPPGFFFYGILQIRIPEWVAIFFLSGSSGLRDQTHISCIGKQILYHWATREAPYQLVLDINIVPTLEVMKLT